MQLSLVLNYYFFPLLGCNSQLLIHNKTKVRDANKELLA